MKLRHFLIVLCALLVASCSTQRGFSKKRHTHRKWINVEKKLDHKDFAQQTKPALEETLNQKQTKTVITKTTDKVEQPVSKSNTKSSTQKTSKVTVSKRAPIVSDHNRNHIESILKSDQPTQLVTEEHNTTKDILTSEETQTQMSPSKTAEKSISELILLAILIVLIILVLSYLDGLLGGILGLLLIIFLILLLLRYLGVL